MEAEDRKLVTKEVAELVGMKPASWRARVARGDAPKPDGQFDQRTPWWRESTVAAFVATRKPPGRPRKSESQG
jgi:predicted DNA-binding transcriptional regulator AlpA